MCRRSISHVICLQGIESRLLIPPWKVFSPQSFWWEISLYWPPPQKGTVSVRFVLAAGVCLHSACQYFNPCIASFSVFLAFVTKFLKKALLSPSSKKWLLGSASRKRCLIINELNNSDPYLFLMHLDSGLIKCTSAHFLKEYYGNDIV